MTPTEFSSKLVLLEQSLIQYAIYLTHDKNNAYDLLQDTYLKALTHSHRFDTSTNLKAWTYTIMRNTFINSYRRNVRENTTFDNSKDLYFLSCNNYVVNISPESMVHEAEIRKEIEKLTDELKVPFKMFLDGYKYHEIADIQGLKIGTVKSRIFFTRKKLMSVLPAV